MELTIDQTAIINSTQNLIVQSFSGTGKTETILGLIRKNELKSILLLVSSDTEKRRYTEKLSKEKMRHVRIETPYSLAWKKIGHKKISVKNDGYSPFEIKSILNINSSNGIYDLRIAYFIQKMSICCCSATSKTLAKQNFLKSLYSEQELTFFWENEEKLVNYMNEFIDLMHRWVIPCIPEFYLMLYSSSEPIIRSKIIILDEAQNVSHCFLESVKKQNSRIILFGDEHQRTSRCGNWLSSFDNSLFSPKKLTDSLTYNQLIANKAIEILDLKKLFFENFATTHIKGLEMNQKIESRAIIGRHKESIINKVIESHFSETETDFFLFAGGLDMYLKTDDGVSIKDFIHLYTEEHSRITHPFLQAMESFSFLEQYAESMNDMSYLGLIRLVKKHRKGLPGIIKSIGKSQNDLPKNKSKIISLSVSGNTSQYDEVILLNDFITAEGIEKTIRFNQNIDFFVLEKEINLLYMASTCARKKVGIVSGISEESIDHSGTGKTKSVNKNQIIIENEMSETDRREMIYNLDQSKKVHKNTFTKWTKQQDQDLVNMHDKQKNMDEIAKILSRTKAAVSSRLKKLKENR